MGIEEVKTVKKKSEIKRFANSVQTYKWLSRSVTLLGFSTITSLFTSSLFSNRMLKGLLVGSGGIKAAAALGVFLTSIVLNTYSRATDPVLKRKRTAMIIIDRTAKKVLGVDIKKVVNFFKRWWQRVTTGSQTNKEVKDKIRKQNQITWVSHPLWAPVDSVAKQVARISQYLGYSTEKFIFMAYLYYSNKKLDEKKNPSKSEGDSCKSVEK